MENQKYSIELNVAVRVVHMACSLCEKVQKQLLSTNPDQVKSKDDDSLVTVAGTLILSSVPFLLCLIWVLFEAICFCFLFICMGYWMIRILRLGLPNF